MLAQKYRLKSKFDFRKIYKYGQSIVNPYAVLYLFSRREKITSARGPRIGFSVSKKIGSAVTRNQIKRKMRAAIKPSLQCMPQNVDVIFIARKKIKGIPFSDVEKSMNNLLKRAGLI
ncbi:MAG: ribonuclease P protein component [Clostridia bacterium]|nr:ribonuclease P protein component [Clostridia bacterium]MDD4665322.1 ribonuclease P protein component [Clostridia bacterium]